MDAFMAACMAQAPIVRDLSLLRVHDPDHQLWLRLQMASLAFSS
jgi:hypothetical protein